MTDTICVILSPGRGHIWSVSGSPGVISAVMLLQISLRYQFTDSSCLQHLTAGLRASSFIVFTGKLPLRNLLSKGGHLQGKADWRIISPAIGKLTMNPQPNIDQL